MENNKTLNRMFLFPLLFCICQLAIVVQVQAEDGGPATELIFETALTRLNTFVGLLRDKFLQEDKLLRPEQVIKMNALNKPDYMLFRLMALFAHYRFNDDGTDWGAWIRQTAEWPPKMPAVKETKSAETARKQANAQTHVAFVANMCAIVHNYGMHSNIKFSELFLVFERMPAIKRYIEAKAQLLAERTGKRFWHEFQLEKQHVAGVYGQSDYGLLTMYLNEYEKPENEKASGYLNRADMANKNAISWSGSYKGYTLHRQKSISEFMAKLVNDGDDIFAQPETFLHLTEQAFQNDRGVHNIFEYLAIQVGYDKWLRKYMEVKNGGGAAKGKQARQGAEQAKEKEQIVSAILQSLENVSKEMHDEKGAEMSHHFHSTEANAAEEQEEEEEMAEVENAKSEQEILLRLQGKLIKVFTKMYLTIWDAPLNNKKQNLRLYENAYNALHAVEEHYAKTHGIGKWRTVLAVATNQMEKKLVEEIAVQGTEGASGDVGEATIGYGWMFASENFIENALVRAKQQLDKEQPPKKHGGTPAVNSPKGHRDAAKAKSPVAVKHHN